jgi:hypothetical protein
MNKFELGVTVEDIVTGYRGVIVARVEYLTGCTQYGIVGKVGADGKVPGAEYFDEDRLVLIETVPALRLTSTSDAPPIGDNLGRDTPRR